MAEHRWAKSRAQEPKTPRGRQSRDRLLSAAERVFAQYGYYGASVSEIVRQANVSQGTFYSYFDSKKDAFVKCFESMNELLISRTRTASKAAPDFMSSEAAGFREFFDLVLEHRALYSISRQAEVVDPNLTGRFYSNIAQGYQRRLTAAMARHDIRPGDAEVMAYCLMGIADFVGMRWPYWTNEPIPESVVEEVVAFIVAAIRRAPAAEDGERPAGDEA